ncbi:MAG: cyclopropane-fatty-acyl-phospholipid synthase family protein, partial [Pseudomonadota bacterium]
EPDLSLHDAQTAKYEAVCDALDLAQGDAVLEVGCGWGGFAEVAADAGADVTAITLSHRQLDYAARRLATRTVAHADDGSGGADGGPVGEAPAPGKVMFALEDYRDVSGQYDKIASIEMIEAVGEENWPTYFRTIHDRLKPGGLAAIQVITIRESSYDNYRAKPDFIQRFIFPGGMLPTKTHLREIAVEAGLEPTGHMVFGSSYARTLVEWRDRFDANQSAITALGFDARFAKLWRYYLTYCEAGFDRGVIDVGIYSYRRPLVA